MKFFKVYYAEKVHVYYLELLFYLNMRGHPLSSSPKNPEPGLQQKLLHSVSVSFTGSCWAKVRWLEPSHPFSMVSHITESI